MTNYLLLILTSICWGSWSNALKFTRNYKQNLFYLDFTVSSFILALLIFVANAGSFSLFTSTRIFIPLVGGMIFAFGNLLLVKSIDKYGFSLSFPSIIGGAVIIGGLLNYLKTPTNNPFIFFPGLILIFLAIVVDSYLYKGRGAHKKIKFLDLVLGAFFIGVFPLFWNFGSVSFGVSELFLILLTGHLLGVGFATILFKYLTAKDLYEYKKTFGSNHAISLIGAAIWVFGTYLNMVIGSKVGFGVSFVVGNIAPLFSAIWGIFYWKEININKGKNRLVFASMTFLFLLGVIFIGNS